MKSHKTKENFCEICLKILNENVTLDCSHSFCKNCLKTSWKKQIKQNRDICCPLENCGNIVGNYIFENIIPIKHLKKMISHECTDCSQPIIPLKLSCQHKFCSKCAHIKVKKALDNNEMIVCWIEDCQTFLSEKDVINLGLPADYIRKYQKICNDINKLIDKNNISINERNSDYIENNQANLIENQPQSIYISTDQNQLCNLCNVFQLKKNAINLDCGHCFCKKCFKDYCRENIISNKKLILCPQTSCLKEINDFFLEDNLSSKEIAYFHSFQDKKNEKNEKNWKVEGRKKGNIIKRKDMKHDGDISFCEKCDKIVCSQCRDKNSNKEKTKKDNKSCFCSSMIFNCLGKLKNNN